MRAFITGSRVYGLPRADSDVDLVIRCDQETKDTLDALSDSEKKIVFGRLNIIPCLTDERYDIWREATRQLINLSKDEQRPVTRAEAKELILGMIEASEDKTDDRPSGDDPLDELIDRLD